MVRAPIQGRMGWHGTLTMPVTQKTKVPLVIPVSAEMAEAINAAAPSEHVTFLINERGRSFGAKKFGEWFSEQCRRAGLNGVSAHGLRKGACRRLAEAGCTAPQIASISGHASFAEGTRYIRRPTGQSSRALPWTRSERQHRVSNLHAESV